MNRSILLVCYRILIISRYHTGNILPAASIWIKIHIFPLMGSVGIDDCCCNTKRLSRNGFCLCKTTETEYVTFAALRIDSLKHTLFLIRLSCDSKTTSSLTVRYCCIGCDQIYMVPVIYTVSAVSCKAAIIHHVKITHAISCLQLETVKPCGTCCVENSTIDCDNLCAAYGKGLADSLPSPVNIGVCIFCQKFQSICHRLIRKTNCQSCSCLCIV